jgi:predicted transcriptional regulator
MRRDGAIGPIDSGRLTAGDYIPILFSMTTTVHLPADLLERVDERARRLKVSRNQYVRRALERMIEKDTTWSSRFLQTLDEAGSDGEAPRAVTEMMRAISRRSRKDPPAL